MTKALIYTRISSDPKHDGLGVERQERECRELCERLGWQVVAVFVDDDVSAYSGKRRPEYLAMLQAITDKAAGAIVAWHPDRLHRSPRELETFIDLVEANRVKVQTVMAGEYDLSTASGRMTARVVGAVSRHESEHKSERVKAKMRQNAEAGKPGGGPNRPFGFLEDRVTIDPVEADVIREVCRRLLNGDTLRSTTVWLNSTGSRTQTGLEWTPQRLRDMAINPRHAGLRAVGRRSNAKVVGDALWPAIIDRATHDRLRTLLLDPARRTNRSARKYLLSNLLLCGRCGRKMYSRPRTERPDPVEGGATRMYACIADPGKMGCGRCSVRSRDIEGFVGDAAVVEFTRMAAAGMFRPAPIAENDEVSAELAVLDRKAARLGAQWAADEISDAAFDAATAGLIERRNTLSALVRRQVSTTSPMLAELAEHPDEFGERWHTDEGFTFDQRRTLILAMVDSITIDPGATGRYGFDDTRVHVAWKAGR